MRQTPLAADITAENQGLQDSIEATFTGVCDVKRPTLTPDGKGGFTSVLNIVGNDIDVAINVHNVLPEDELASKVKGQTLYVIHLVAGTDVKIQDVIVTSDQSYEVVGIGPAVSIEVAKTVYGVTAK